MRKLTVRLTRSPGEELTVGQLAEDGRRIYFAYAAAFLETAIELSPFKLPARPGLTEHLDRSFGPLPGLFDDSLPDGWGLLLMDRHFRRQGLDPAALSPLDRLAYLGTRTMGALTYHPPLAAERDEQLLDLDALGKHAEDVLAGETREILPQLLRAGGSPGGARPKVIIGVKGERLLSGEDDLPEGYEHWMIKLAARADVNKPASTCLRCACSKRHRLAATSACDGTTACPATGGFTSTPSPTSFKSTSGSLRPTTPTCSR